MARVTLTLADFGMTPRGRRARMRRIADGIVAMWKSLASERLGSTSAAYRAAIGIAEVGENRCVVRLPMVEDPRTAVVARIVELGMGPGGIGTEGPYDVRAFVLRASTRHLRWGKNGPYVNVPFNRTGAMIKALGGRGARSAAAALIGTAQAARGERLASGHAPKIKAHHVSDALAGLIRRVSSYSKQDGGVVTQTSGYRLWRRASWAGQPWTSPGVKGRHLAGEVICRLPEIIAEVL